jgi:hypothetical protein
MKFRDIKYAASLLLLSRWRSVEAKRACERGLDQLWLRRVSDRLYRSQELPSFYFVKLS